MENERPQSGQLPAAPGDGAGGAADAAGSDAGGRGGEGDGEGEGEGDMSVVVAADAGTGPRRAAGAVRDCSVARTAARSRPCDHPSAAKAMLRVATAPSTSTAEMA